MGALGYLYYPWGFIVQALALVHFVRRRPDGFWLWVILFGGFLGAAVYLVVEAVPDLGLLRGSFQGIGRRSHIRQLETTILDNPSAGNLEELADLYREENQAAKARELYDRAIATRSDSVHAFYHRALCALALNDFPAAAADLEYVVGKDFKFAYHRAAALLAHSYHKTEQPERAAAQFAAVTQLSDTPETLYFYATFLLSQKQTAEAREVLEKLLRKKRTLPRFMVRVERPWFQRADALLKELRPA